MKRNIILIAILFLAFCAKTQNTEYAFLRYKYFWGYFDNSYGSKENKEKLVKTGVSGYTETSKDKKNEYVSSKVVYDKNGNVTSTTFYKKNGKISSTYFFEYNEKNMLITQRFINGKNKERLRLNITYDQLNNALEENFSNNGKLKAKTISTYDSTRVLESYFYKKGSSQFSKKWVYTYNSDKTKKSSVIYDSKGKVLYAWNYECKPEGELQNKHKDTTDVCKKIEYDSSGNKTVTVRKFNEKGKAYKVVSVYDKNDKIIQYLSYNSKEQLSYSYKYTTEAKGISESINYHKGKENYRYQYMYDDNNNQTGSMSYHKGKLVNHSEYTYNDNNLMISHTWYGKKDKWYQTKKYEYLFFL